MSHAEREAKQLGRLAIEQGWATPSQLALVLGEMVGERRAGVRKSIGRRLIDAGLIDEVQLEQLLELQGKRSVRCPRPGCGWGASASVEEQLNFCARCGAPLADEPAPRGDRGADAPQQWRRGGTAAEPVAIDPRAEPEGVWDFGEYAIVEPLGVGGMGEVFLAERDGEMVAIKVLASAVSDHVEYQRRFEREARLTQRLVHPGIVQVYDYGRASGRMYLVMEHVRGGTLAEHVAERVPLAPEDATRIVLELAQAVAYAHDQGVLHRDVKPSNVLIEAGSGRLKLADFGLVKRFESSLDGETVLSHGQLYGIEAAFRKEMADLYKHDERELGEPLARLSEAMRGLASSANDPFLELDRAPLPAAELGDHTRTVGLLSSGVCLGTPTFMPPEQLAGIAIDGRADIYSLGVLYFYLLTGTYPFEPSASLEEVYLQRSTVDPPGVRSREPGVPPAHAQVVARMIARLPDRRYQTARFLCEDLGRLLAGDPPWLDAPRWWDQRVAAIDPTRTGYDACDCLATLFMELADRARLVEDLPREPIPRPAPRGGDQDASPRAPGRSIRPSSQSTSAIRSRSGGSTRRVRAPRSAPDVLTNRGIRRKARGWVDGAIADYDRALAIDSRFAKALFHRGSARQAAGDLEGALVDYDRALAQRPNYAKAYNNRGNVRRSQGDLDAALADYDSALAIEPDYPEALINRGMVHKAHGDLERALADHDRALELVPDYVEALCNRGTIHQARGALDESIADYDAALALKPDFLKARYNRGIAYQAQGVLDLALADFDQALAQRPDYVKAHFHRGNVLQSVGDHEAALEDYDWIVEVEPKHWRAWANRAISLSHKGRLDEAHESIDEAAAACPAAMVDWLAGVRARLG